MFEVTVIRTRVGLKKRLATIAIHKGNAQKAVLNEKTLALGKIFTTSAQLEREGGRRKLCFAWTTGRLLSS